MHQGHLALCFCDFVVVTEVIVEAVLGASSWVEPNVGTLGSPEYSQLNWLKCAEMGHNISGPYSESHQHSENNSEHPIPA